jgi:pyruvate dehydrogenase E2 component (dihydrolipoamide acetyltransferase)
MKHTIILPDLGQTTSEAKVVRWLKRPGDKLSSGESLLEVETDKATMEVEAYVGGYLRETLVEEGEAVSAMAPVAILTDQPDESYPDEAPAGPSTQTAAPQPRRPEPSPPMTSPTPIAAVPAARSLAKKLGINLDSVVGTGPQGLITKNDVERVIAERSGSRPVPPAAQPEFKSLSAMASITTSSKSTIPHFYVTTDVDVSAAEVWRASWNDSHPDMKASINDVFVRAASQALLESPRLNVRYQDGKYEQRSNGDVLLVIALDSVLTLASFANAHALPWDEYLRGMKRTLERARGERIVASPLESGEVAAKNLTQTDQSTNSKNSVPLLAISNLGMFGVKEFAAIIPPGCTAVLAIGAVREKVILRDKQPEVIKVCSLTLSADHRVVDGIAAAKFMERVQVRLNSL